MKISKYVEGIRGYLEEKYGSIPPEWETMLLLLKDNLELYVKCKDSVKKNGIYNTEKGLKNPLLSTMKDLQASIMKQVQHFGLSPWSASKIHPDSEDDNEDFIEGLTSE